jgi:hypothetical protein
MLVAVRLVPSGRLTRATQRPLLPRRQRLPWRCPLTVNPPQLDEALEVVRVYPHAAADSDACQLAPLDEQVHLVPGQREIVRHLGDREELHGCGSLAKAA